MEVIGPVHARWHRLAPVMLALFCTYAYFIPAPGWNQNSRLALTRALAEHGTVQIDAHHETTGDKSLRDGHFYSDKAPGASLLALPAYEILYLSRRALGADLPTISVRPMDAADDVADRDPDLADRKPGDRISYNLAHRLALWVCGVATGGIMTVMAVGMLFLLAWHQLGGKARQAGLVALAYGLGTLALPYAGAFYGHQLCADFLIVAFGLCVLLPPARPTRAGPVLVGASLGLAVLCEYPAIIPAAAISGFLWWRLGGRSFGWLAAGAAPLALILFGYHVVAFGHPLATGYDYVYLEPFARGMEVRYGIHAPSATVIGQLLFGSYRGLFYLSPVLLLAVWGLAYQLGRSKASGPGLGPGRPALWLASSVVVYYLLLNGGYYMWDGGSAAGPRHLIPAIPFLCLGLAPAVTSVPRAFHGLAAVSVLQAVVVAAASPEAPPHGNPLWDFALPKLMASDASRDMGATNLGLLLGLSGVLSLLPLVAMWGVTLMGRKGASTGTQPLV